MVDSSMKTKSVNDKSIDLISLVNSHEKPCVVISKDYEIMAINPAYEKEYDIHRDQSIGKMCYQVIRGRDRPCKLDGDECPHYDIFQAPDNNIKTMHYDAIHHSTPVNITAFPLKNSENELFLGKRIDVLKQDRNTYITADRMVGQSDSFIQCLNHLKVAANSDVPVLLNGDTGTGKELAAIYIHQHSSRSSSPFQIIDCTVLTQATFESEIYGHVTGAYSGCVGDKLGLFEMSDGGTIFLDKIGDLEYSLQSKLLRIIETGKFRRVGSTELRTSDVRVICATNKKLWELVVAGKFREDLYHRIVCLNIRIPTLAERSEDIPVIAKSLLDDINQSGNTTYHLQEDAAEHLRAYTYSGNIRELKNILLTATAESSEDEITFETIENVLKNMHGMELDNVSQRDRNTIPSIDQIMEHNNVSASLNRIEELHLKDLLKKHNGNRKKCADALGVCERTLYRKLKKFGLK